MLTVEPWELFTSATSLHPSSSRVDRDAESPKQNDTMTVAGVQTLSLLLIGSPNRSYLNLHACNIIS
jgi:hypothetical protein